jgi:hypothetical protein
MAWARLNGAFPVHLAVGHHPTTVTNQSDPARSLFSFVETVFLL